MADQAEPTSDEIIEELFRVMLENPSIALHVHLYMVLHLVLVTLPYDITEKFEASMAEVNGLWLSLPNNEDLLKVLEKSAEYSELLTNEARRVLARCTPHEQDGSN